MRTVLGRLAPALALALTALPLAAPPLGASVPARPSSALATPQGPPLEPPPPPPLASTLTERFRAWLEEVEVLMTEEERTAFLALSQDYERDSFIQRFWQVRDPNPRTAANEMRDRFEANVREARQRYGDLRDARARTLLLNGPPAEVVKSDCSLLLWPLEAWFYSRSDRVPFEFFVVFYRKWGGGPFRVWDPGEGIDVLFANGVGERRANAEGPPGTIDSGRRGGVARGGDPEAPSGEGGHSLGEIADFQNPCGTDEHARKIVVAVGWVLGQGMGWQLLEAKFMARPEGPGGEWVNGFRSYSTEVPAGTAPLAGRLDLEFPGRLQSRTVVQGLVRIPAAAAEVAALGAARTYNFLLNGEILAGDALFDRFRYRFDLPARELQAPPLQAAQEGAGSGEALLPLVFQRTLRPGDYRLIVRVEDLASGKMFREERAIQVPLVEGPPPPSLPEDLEAARLFAEANAALASGETTLRLVPPIGELQSGMVRFETLATGPIAHVTFTLDGQPLLTKKKPPFSVELDLGAAPQAHLLAATAYDAAGNAVADDEIALNTAGNRFRVRLLEPQKGKRYEHSLLARPQVDLPEGGTLDRLEIFLNDDRVATLYQPPFSQPVSLPGGSELTYVRAVAYLTDGRSAEGMAFVNAPPDLAEVEVDLVELYTSVFDRKGRPVAGLHQDDFAVAEDGKGQDLVRFEAVTDQPIHVAVALDISASMEKSLEAAQQAALHFLQSTLKGKDRAAIVTFNDHPQLAARFTGDLEALAGGLAGLKAERGTALYDSLIYTLYAFNGIKGRRAVLLLSDGQDEGSRFGFEAALEFARRAGIAIYTLGLGAKVDRASLSTLAEETGGRAFFVRDAAELPALYAAIETELRTQYLLAYQSSSTRPDRNFRAVEVKMRRPGQAARTIRGYYP